MTDAIQTDELGLEDRDPILPEVEDSRAGRDGEYAGRDRRSRYWDYESHSRVSSIPIGSISIY